MGSQAVVRDLSHFGDPVSTRVLSCFARALAIAAERGPRYRGRDGDADAIHDVVAGFGWIPYRLDSRNPHPCERRGELPETGRGKAAELRSCGFPPLIRIKISSFLVLPRLYLDNCAGPLLFALIIPSCAQRQHPRPTASQDFHVGLVWPSPSGLDANLTRIVVLLWTGLSLGKILLHPASNLPPAPLVLLHPSSPLLFRPGSPCHFLCPTLTPTPLFNYMIPAASASKLVEGAQYTREPT